MDKFINDVTTELVLPGITGKYTFLHISDSHINTFDALSTEKEKADAIEHEKAWDRVKEDFAHFYNEPFNDSHRVTSTEEFDKIIHYVNQEKPDMLLIAGDTVDFIYPAAMRFLASRLKMLEVPYLLVPGNHEGSVDTDEALLPFTGGRSIQIKDFGEFCIVGVNDSEKTVSDAQISELEEFLSLGKPTVVMMHIPICTGENREKMSVVSPYFYIDIASAEGNAARLIRALQRDNVKLLLCGHLHGMNVSEYAEGKTQFCSSSSMAGFVHRLIIRGEDI